MDEYLCPPLPYHSPYRSPYCMPVAPPPTFMHQ